jgi:hypothetical chaperone protein
MLYEAARPELVERMIVIVSHRQGHHLAGKVEAAKVAMTSQGEARIELQLTDERLDVPVTSRDLDRAIEAAVDRIGEKAAGTIRDAGLTPSRIGTIFLTGGSTAVNLVRRRILAAAPEARVVDGDMFGSVGLGLALVAERKFACSLTPQPFGSTCRRLVRRDRRAPSRSRDRGRPGCVCRGNRCG